VVGGPGRGGRARARARPRYAGRPRCRRRCAATASRRSARRAGGPVRRRPRPGRSAARPAGPARWPAAWSRCRGRRPRTPPRAGRRRQRGVQLGRPQRRQVGRQQRHAVAREPPHRGVAPCASAGLSPASGSSGSTRRLRPAIAARAPGRRSPRTAGPPRRRPAPAAPCPREGQRQLFVLRPRPAHRVQPGLGQPQAPDRDDHGPPHGAPGYPPRAGCRGRVDTGAGGREDCACNDGGVVAEEVGRGEAGAQECRALDLARGGAGEADQRGLLQGGAGAAASTSRRPAGAVLVANHVSQADWITLAEFVWDSGRIPRFLIKDSLFRVRGVRNLLRGASQIPVSRGTAAARNSLEEAHAALARGRDRVHLPGGHRHPRPRLLADAGADRGGPAGVGDRRADHPGRQLGPAGGGRRRAQEGTAAAPARDLVRGRDRRWTCRRTGAAADLGPAPRGDRRDHGAGPRPAGRGARRDARRRSSSAARRPARRPDAHRPSSAPAPGGPRSRRCSPTPAAT
jgi:1-acyl-sn-glycerol-3-phosphate acyltransferase